jgi:hypothetical protein
LGSEDDPQNTKMKERTQEVIENNQRGKIGTPTKRAKPHHGSWVEIGGDKNNLAPQVGFEPTTLRLTAECSTIELLRSNAENGLL